MCVGVERLRRVRSGSLTVLRSEPGGEFTTTTGVYGSIEHVMYMTTTYTGIEYDPVYDLCIQNLSD